MKKIIYNTIGGISFSIGVVGAFVPLLPSTCFILLATWAFAKSSPKFYAWLSYKSPFAQSIQDWQQYQIVPTRVKWIAAISMATSYSITVTLVDNIYVLVGIGIGLLSLIAYLFSKPSRAQKITYQQIPELHLPVN